MYFVSGIECRQNEIILAFLGKGVKKTELIDQAWLQLPEIEKSEEEDSEANHSQQPFQILKDFLAKHKIEISIVDDARKKILKEKDVQKLIQTARHLYAVRGKKSIHFDLKKEKPDKESISSAILGRTGNLRAPTIITGKKIIVGFNRDIYLEVLQI